MVTVGRGTTDYRYCDEHAYSLSWWALHNNDPSFDGPEGMLTSVTFTAIPAE